MGHILYICFYTQLHQKITVGECIKAMSRYYKREVLTMAIHERATFNVGGLNNSYIIEWNSLFKAIAVFMSNLYQRKVNIVVRKKSLRNMRKYKFRNMK